MPFRRDDFSVSRLALGVKRGNGVPQPVHSRAVLCADGETAVHPGAHIRCEVAFVAHREHSHVAEVGRLCPHIRGVHDVNDHVRTLCRSQRAPHAFALDGVVAFAYARGVYEVYLHAVALHRAFQRIPRRPRHVRDNGAVRAEQSVHQRAFPRIRSARKHRGDAVLRHIARARRGKQRVHALARVFYLSAQRRQNFVFRFFGVIEHGFQPGDDVAELVAKRVYLSAETAVHKPVRRAQSSRAFGVNHICDAFRVGKRHSARKIRAAGELSPFRHFRARLQGGVQRSAHNAHSAVQIKLNGVLSRIRLCRGEIHRVAAVAEIRGAESAEPHNERRFGKRAGGFAPANENGIGDRKRVLAGHAQNADTTRPYGRGNGSNRAHINASCCLRSS